MIVIHIGILMFPIKDLAESGVVFSKYRFSNYFMISNKLNWSITIGILLYCILLCHYIVKTVNGG